MESWREELYHSGIKGQKWGIRRFQNEDGSLTDEGRIRYGVGNPTDKSAKNLQRDLNKLESEKSKQVYRKEYSQTFYEGKKGTDSYYKAYYNEKESTKEISRIDKEIKNLINNTKLSGYDVSSKEIKRYAKAGEDVVNALKLGGLGAGALLSFGGNPLGLASAAGLGMMVVKSSLDETRHNGIVKGNKYTVKRKSGE